MELKAVNPQEMSGMLATIQSETKPTLTERSPADVVGFPKRYASLAWKDVTRTSDNKEVIAAAEDWIEQKTDNLFLYGPQGTGKTHIACAAMLASQRRKLAFFSLPLVMLDFQASVKEHDELEVIQRVIDIRTSRGQTQAILFDDVAAHRVSDFGIEMFCIMLEKLYSSMADGFLFTSNLSPKQIRETMGERVSSRLCGLARPVKIEGKDLRISK